MAERQRSVAGRLRLAAILVVGLIAVILLLDVLLLFSIQAEINLVDRYGFGHVPRAEMAPFIKIGSVSPAVAALLGFLKVICFAFFLYQSAKALDRLDIAHRFSKIFTGLSIFIPFVSFYVPWAALGEARQTFKIGGAPGKTGGAPGITPVQSVRRFDAASFWLGVAWILNVFVGSILGRIGDNDKIVDLASFKATLATAQGVLTTEIISSSIAGLVFILYVRDFLRLYRAALARSVTEVFEAPATPHTPERDAVQA